MSESHHLRPLYEHDCTACQYLGPYLTPETQVYEDLYYCPEPGEPTLIARFGNRGPEYRSAPAYMIERLSTPSYHEVWRRAQRYGLLATDSDSDSDS